MSENKPLVSVRIPERSAQRTVVIGLDSADIDLIERWADEGHLPYLSRLLASSPLVRLQTSTRVLQGSVWPTLTTGVSLGVHGSYYREQIKNGAYDIKQIRADHMGAKPFFQELSDAGVRCAIVDVPKNRLFIPLNGLQVVSWGTEEEEAYWERCTQPPELLREISERVGPYPPISFRHFKSLRELREKLERAVQVKTALGQLLLQRGDWNFLFLVYSESHRAGHYFWKYWDAQHPEHEPTADAYLRDALREIYRGLDQGIQTLAEALGPGDNLVILSGHGMGPNYNGRHLIEEVLTRLGLLVHKGAARQPAPSVSSDNGKKVASGSWKTLLRSRLGHVLPSSLKPLLRRAIGAREVDWSRTRAFTLPSDLHGCIRINLQGREPRGIVKPGEEYNALLQRIESELRALINPDTGREAVEEVFLMRQLYPGPRADDLPDISVLWRSETPIRAVTSPAVGLLQKEPHEARSGNHRPEGFFVARGPAFRAGATEHEGDILQVAPTLLQLFGVQSPRRYEMGPLEEILAADHHPLEARP